MGERDGRSKIEISIDELLRRDRLTRRAFMRRAGRGTIAIGSLMSLPAILAACVPAGNASACGSDRHRCRPNVVLGQFWN